MSHYLATIAWQRKDSVFTDNKYSREHLWQFDGGIQVAASASPHAVPLPFSVLEAVDPEEAFVAALASCHMLWFLSIAAKHGFVVDAYRDEAAGIIAKNAAEKESHRNLHPGQGTGRMPRTRDSGAGNDPFADRLGVSFQFR